MENEKQLAFVFALLKIDRCFLQTRNVARHKHDFSESAKCFQERASVLLVGSVCVWSICRDITLKFTDVTEDKSCPKNSKLTDMLITITQKFRTI